MPQSPASKPKYKYITEKKLRQFLVSHETVEMYHYT